jgi:hypothetical protein
MVIAEKYRRFLNVPIYFFWILFLYSSQISAAVFAEVDRERVELNESFTLKIIVDTSIDSEPDVTAVEKDFTVGSRSQLSNTTIVNGKITRSRTWSYSLMAKRTGFLTIPSVMVGGDKSNEVDIQVLPQSSVIPGEADIFISSEVDFQQSFVQAQILYKVKIFRGVATRQARIIEPKLSGADVLKEILGEDRNYESKMNGKNYNVLERVYAIFPQQSGQIHIGSSIFEARIVKNGRITGKKLFQSEPITVKVNPIPPPPVAFPNAKWLPAKSVNLNQEWSRNLDKLSAGEPITRHIIVKVLGQLSTQIPLLDIEQVKNIKIYPDKPELLDAIVPGGVLATRKDQYAMIGVVAQDVVLPEIHLPWWDINENIWKISSLPAFALKIIPSNDIELIQLSENIEPAEILVNPAEVIYSNYWKYISQIFIVIWILTVLLWWQSTRPKKKTYPIKEPPIYKQQAKLLRKARKAAIEGDAKSVKLLLLNWGRLQWRENTPNSMRELSELVTEPLSLELDRFCEVTYGPNSNDSWDGQVLAKALRKITIKKTFKDLSEKDILPPLMPS